MKPVARYKEILLGHHGEKLRIRLEMILREKLVSRLEEKIWKGGDE